MRMRMVNLQLPEDADQFYRREAKKRMLSKSAVMREVLWDHVLKNIPASAYTTNKNRGQHD